MTWRTFFLFLSIVPEALSLTCLQCKGISQPRHCKVVDDCYSGEVCSVEKVQNIFGETLYNVGCVPEARCQNISKTINDNGECRECCKNDLCNAQGCGESGYPQNRGPICYNCRQPTNQDMCHEIAFCEPGDVCKNIVLREFGDIFYSSECSTPHECDNGFEQGSAIVGRDVFDTETIDGHPNFHRSVTERVCSGCCHDDLCNKRCNNSTIKQDYQNNVTVTDCYDVYHKNVGNSSGVYTVKLWESGRLIQVYCDMDTFPHGWTVFQKRYDGSVDFYRNFTEYVNGFGNVHGEFWLGLSYIKEMVSQYKSDLRLTVTAADYSGLFEQFENFSLSKYPDFALHIGQQTVSPIPGNTYGFSYLNGSKFSTFDHDAELYSSNCAEYQHGGWWYRDCSQSNLNGEYISPPGGQSSYSSGWGGFIYYAWKSYATLRSSQIMFCKHIA